MDNTDLAQHISRQYDQELEDVRNRVLAMGGLVEDQIQKAIEALINSDSELGESVVLEDYKVNEMEVSIDEECSRILALRHPTASDLRLVVAIIKTITDLERIGDEAEKIGFLATRLASRPQISNRYRDIKHLGRHVGRMVHDALNTFARLDADEAFNVAKQDEEVDKDYESIMRQLITVMMEDPRTIRQVLDVMWVARSLERIGDHAKNICEYVIYLVHGKDVRHTKLREHDSLAEAEEHLKD